MSYISGTKGEGKALFVFVSCPRPPTPPWAKTDSLLASIVPISPHLLFSKHLVRGFWGLVDQDLVVSGVFCGDVCGRTE